MRKITFYIKILSFKGRKSNKATLKIFFLCLQGLLVFTLSFSTSCFVQKLVKKFVVQNFEILVNSSHMLMKFMKFMVQ